MISFKKIVPQIEEMDRETLVDLDVTLEKLFNSPLWSVLSKSLSDLKVLHATICMRITQLNVIKKEIKK